MSGICSRYYKTNKDNPDIPERFLRHLKKVGSYYSALVDITACACNEKYKKQFSDMDLVLLKPVIDSQPIFSWTSVIKKSVHITEEYEKFKKSCLHDHVIFDKLKEIYGTDNNNPHLDEEKIKQHLYLHAEMNILKDIINQRDKRPVFIALYHRWLLPDTKDVTFKNDALKYMITDLDRIIRKELLDKHVDIRARSDSEGESGNSDYAVHVDAKVDDLIESELFGACLSTIDDFAGDLFPEVTDLQAGVDSLTTCSGRVTGSALVMEILLTVNQV
ncbi:14537_t:CDS:2 [Funneliformis mosseae]|uniref:14537_t:CDS:1 n=1 Tax=Funneliformis mosseae TaxID=27381 RepID=A0A9N9EFS7_FUNMO|nr:14537_t:CDS:2 [Funneliformis mosseae]